MAKAVPVRTVSGVVRDEAGKPIVGVSVISVKDRQCGTSTAADGTFSFRVPADETHIAVSMIANMTYQVLGRPKAASFLSSLRLGWCFLPLILTLPGWFGLTGLCASQPLAEVLATLVSLRWIRAIVLEADDLTAKKNASRKV